MHLVTGASLLALFNRVYPLPISDPQDPWARFLPAYMVNLTTACMQC